MLVINTNLSPISHRLATALYNITVARQKRRCSLCHLRVD